MEKADRAVEICNEVEMRAGGEGESDGGRGRLTSNLTCEWPLAEWRHGQRRRDTLTVYRDRRPTPPPSL